MATIINFRQGNKNLLRKNTFERNIDLYERARLLADDFAQSHEACPEQAVQGLESYFLQARSIAPNKAELQDVNITWLSSFLDLIGHFYPGWDREMRTIALARTLDYLDDLNYDDARANVSMIDEPWLCRDIVINRCLYGATVHAYDMSLRKVRGWDEFEGVAELSPSKFWLALAITKKEGAWLGVRYGYRRAYPDVWDRTLDAVAAFADVAQLYLMQEERMRPQDALDAALEEYDPTLRPEIIRKMQEEKWIILPEEGSGTARPYSLS